MHIPLLKRTQILPDRRQVDARAQKPFYRTHSDGSLEKRMGMYDFNSMLSGLSTRKQPGCLVVAQVVCRCRLVSRPWPHWAFGNTSAEKQNMVVEIRAGCFLLVEAPRTLCACRAIRTVRSRRSV